MKRAELVNSREYWITKFQIELFNELYSFMKSKGWNKTRLAKELGVTKGYISQILNGNFDHKISKLVDLSLAMRKAPQLKFEPIEQYESISRGKRISSGKFNDAQISNQYYIVVSSTSQSPKKGVKLNFDPKDAIKVEATQVC